MTLFTEYQLRSCFRALKAYEQDYLGLGEFAAVCGVTKTCFSNWRKRGKIIEPDQQLQMGPVWHWKTVRKWLRSHKE